VVHSLSLAMSVDTVVVGAKTYNWQ